MYCLISAKKTSFSTEIVFFFCFWLFEKRHKMAQMVRKILFLD